MKIKWTRSWSRIAQLGAGLIGCVAVIVATQSAGASAKSHDEADANGVAQRLANVEYAQEVSEAKLEITQQQSLYGLLFNGDGPNGPDRKKWGDQIFTGDEHFLAYDANVNLIASQSFEHMSDEIAGAIASQPKVWPNTATGRCTSCLRLPSTALRLRLQSPERRPSVSMPKKVPKRSTQLRFGFTGTPGRRPMPAGGRLRVPGTGSTSDRLMRCPSDR